MGSVSEENDTDSVVNTTMAPGCPVLDFSWFEQGEEKKTKLAHAVVKALSDDGYLYLINHGIPNEEIVEAFVMAKDLFALPMATKASYLRPKGPADDTGFIPVDHEKLASIDKLDTPPEQRESFNFLMYADNKNPKELPKFKETLSTLSWSSMKLCNQLIELIVIGMNLNTEQAGILERGHRFVGTPESNTKLRLLWYPPVPVAEVPAEKTDAKGETVRLGIHSDYGTLTILFQDETGGLEAKSRAGVWSSVKPLPAIGEGSTVLVQLGDMMEHWTSGILHSTKHRVQLNNPEQASKVRQSIAFFLHPDNDCFIRPLDGSDYKPENNMTFRQFLDIRFSTTYTSDY